MDKLTICDSCKNCFNAYTPYGVWVYLCRQLGVSTMLSKIDSCPLGYEEPEVKEHDLTASVLDLYNL
jgi:hypothetical protein